MTIEPDGLEKRMKYCAGYCEQVAHDGILPSWDWFSENAPTLREAAEALSAAQRLVIEWQLRSDPYHQKCARELAALLSERSPQQEEADPSQRYSRTSGIAAPDASPLSPANAKTEDEIARYYWHGDMGEPAAWFRAAISDAFDSGITFAVRRANTGGQP